MDAKRAAKLKEQFAAAKADHGEYVLLYFRAGDPTFTDIAKNADGTTCIFEYPADAKQYALDNLDFGFVQIQIVPLLGEEV